LRGWAFFHLCLYRKNGGRVARPPSFLAVRRRAGIIPSRQSRVVHQCNWPIGRIHRNSARNIPPHRRSRRPACQEALIRCCPAHPKHERGRTHDHPVPVRRHITLCAQLRAAAHQCGNVDINDPRSTRWNEAIRLHGRRPRYHERIVHRIRPRTPRCIPAYR